MRRAAVAPLLLVGFVAVAVPMGMAGAAGTVTLSSFGSTYTQDFNSLATTGTANTNVPEGWAFAESGTNANTTYRAGTGSDNTGDTYSFGATANTERAFGGLRSGSLVPLVGASFTNGTGGTITSLTVAYTGEQWRLGQNTAGRAADRLDFQLSTDATSLTTGAWTDADSLDFTSPVVTGTVGALDGNAAGNRTPLTFAITNLAVPNGASFWIRWADSDLIPGADDGLSVDDFSLTASGVVDPPLLPSLSIGDVAAPEGNSGSTTFGFVVSLSAPAGPGGVTFDIATTDGTASASDDYVARSLTGQTIPAGQTSYLFPVAVNGDTVLEPDETFFVNVTNGTGATVADGQATGTIRNDDAPPVTPIATIQGAAHLSPLAGQRVQTAPAVVTARRSNGFYLQTPDGAQDADPATSEGIFVFTSSAPPASASVGNLVQVTGLVGEFRPGGSATNLTATQLSAPTIALLSTGNPLPDPVVLAPPTTIIEDDAAGNVETGGVFDPSQDGIDYYESLEGMRVRVDGAVATGPTSDFGSNREIPVVGAGAGPRTPRGGIIIGPLDFNPERIILNDQIAGGPRLPVVDVGASFADATGVVDYSFSNYKVQVTDLGALTPSTITPEVTDAAAVNELAVATFNVENLSPSDGAAKFGALARRIVQNLQSPDLVALEEVQDNNGATNDSTVDASQTLALLIQAIADAGGPQYQARQINPVDDADGGQPGGNIRQAFLFRTDRGLSFVDRPGGTSTSPVAVVAGSSGPELSISPGRVDPANVAFNSSRKPLAGEFTYRGETLFVVANHFNSKGGDQPLFGPAQPPVLSSEVQRIQQATAVAQFVNQVRAVDPDASVLVVGDLNDFEFSAPVQVLEQQASLTPLMETLPAGERYSYVFQGNSQALDHIMMSPSLVARPFEYDSVHLNAEFADQVSDHDPQIVRVRFGSPPTVDAGGPYTVDEGGSVSLTAGGSDPDGDALTYAWDLDGNGSFEAAGQSVTFSAALIDGPSTRTVRVQVTDATGLTAVDEATVVVRNVAPTASASFASASTACAAVSTLTVTFTDPGVADTHSVTVTWGDGTSDTVSGATSPLALVHTYAAAGAYTAAVTVTDDDGDSGSATAATAVRFTTAGIQAPIKADGTSVFNARSTIPVKVAFTDCDGTVPTDLAPTIRLVMLSGATPGLEIDQPISTSRADTGGVMRFSDGTWIYNLSARSLPDPTATYRVVVTVPKTGQTVTAVFGLR